MHKQILLLLFGTVLLDGASADVLVQGALDIELGPLLAALQDKREVEAGNWVFWTGRMHGQRVVVSRTEVGTINAVGATLTGIQRFRPKRIINQGTAGGHSRRVKLWDIVLGEKTVDYAAFQSAHGDTGSGIDPRRWQPKPHVFRMGGRMVPFPHFAGDVRMLDAAARIPYTRGAVLRGTIGTAFQWNRELDYIDGIHRTFGTDSEDMESAHAAGIAAAQGVPFLAVRIISDTEWDHPRFEKIGGQYCAEFVVELIRRLR